jgi:hypothetical protein
VQKGHVKTSFKAAICSVDTVMYNSSTDCMGVGKVLNSCVLMHDNCLIFYIAGWFFGFCSFYLDR